MDWNTLLNETRSNVLNGAEPGRTTKTSGDDRQEFQRDYDRALFSTPVRRLQDKAQVFPLEPNDSVRTRLTHSLEVSNVAASLVRRASGKLQETAPDFTERADDIAAVAATCGLIHDLGNPPFGHAGEEAMRDWFERKLDESVTGTPTLREKLGRSVDGVDLAADFLHFDGNPQTIRLVTKLQMLGDFDGLSLTAGTLSAALKYTAPADGLDDGDHATEKPGYFFSERTLVEKVREATGTGRSRNPLTYLIEAADDIVYSTVDLEDGIKKGAVTWDQLVREFVGGEAAGAFHEIEKGVERSLKKRTDRSGLDLSSGAADEARGQLFRTIVVGAHVDAAVDAFVQHYDAIMAGTFKGEILKEGATKALWKEAKRIARERVFTSSSILRLELMGRQVLFDLMDLFWEGVTRAPYPKGKARRGHPFKAFSLLSENYRTVFDHEVEQDRGTGVPVSYRRLQLVADYICGMTDSYATSLHRELMNG